MNVELTAQSSPRTLLTLRSIRDGAEVASTHGRTRVVQSVGDQNAGSGRRQEGEGDVGEDRVAGAANHAKERVEGEGAHGDETRGEEEQRDVYASLAS